MSTSAVDSLQNALVDTISGTYLKRVRLLWVRLLVLVLTIPCLIVSLRVPPHTFLPPQYPLVCPAHSCAHCFEKLHQIFFQIQNLEGAFAHTHIHTHDHSICVSTLTKIFSGSGLNLLKF